MVIHEQSAGTNRTPNIRMIEQMKAAGISVTLLERPGGHGSFEDERFIDLAEQVLKALGGVISVEAKGKLPVAWGELKGGRY